ncbi:MAG: hypothetical protein AAFV53_16585 [Myxococcota bacterium]
MSKQASHLQEMVETSNQTIKILRKGKAAVESGDVKAAAAAVASVAMVRVLASRQSGEEYVKQITERASNPGRFGSFRQRDGRTGRLHIKRLAGKKLHR